MYTVLRIEENNITTYIMILTDNTCSQYDYLTYDYTKKIFVDENFTYDSFNNDNEKQIKKLIQKIGSMIKEVGLKNLMYNNINKYKDMNIESIHIPENYQFKNEYMENTL